MHPKFSSRVQQYIAHCWQEGIASCAKVSAEAVVRLTDEQMAGRIRLAEVPVVGQVRGHPTRPLGNLRMCLMGQQRGGNEEVTQRRISVSNDKPQKKQKMSHITFDWTAAAEGI